MNYLERNELIIDEVNRKMVPRKERWIGSSRVTTTTSAGYIVSETLGCRLYLAFKRPAKVALTQDNDLALMKFVFGLSTMAKIDESLPGLGRELPVFMGMLVDEEGSYKGIVTEDFTKNGRYRISGCYEFNQNQYDSSDPNIARVKKLFRLSDEEVANMFFMIRGRGWRLRRRLGDVDKALLSFTPKERADNFPVGEILNNIASHQVRLTV